MPRFKNAGQMVSAYEQSSNEPATRFDVCAICIELATTHGVIDGVIDMGFENQLKANEPCGSHLAEVDEDMEEDKCEICFSQLTNADI